MMEDTDFEKLLEVFQLKNQEWSKCETITIDENYRERFAFAITSLHQAGYLPALCEHIEDEVLTLIQENTTPNLDSDIQDYNEFVDYIAKCARCINNIKSLVDFIDDIIKSTVSEPNGDSLSKNCDELHHWMVQPRHQDYLFRAAKEFYKMAYNCSDLRLLYESDEINTDGEECKLCGRDTCVCERVGNSVVNILEQVNTILPFLQPVVCEALYTVIREELHRDINKKCSNVTDVSLINSMEEWFDNKVLTWVENSSGKTLKHSREQKLFVLLYTEFIKLKIEENELLAIIIEYPESRPQLEDIAYCLPKTSLRSQLIQAYKSLLHNRVLHSGVATTEILTIYISAIQTLRIIDPSCVILEVVTEPIKHYLRGREDTVRSIVSSLIDESGPLTEELNKKTSEREQLDEDNIGEDWANWQPDPIDANTDVSSTTRRSTDVINMLINIYGTKELFIKEYWNLLADRILHNSSYSILPELKYFELLKLRFGEADLHQCEVMLKDVSDSKRLNSWINNELDKTRSPGSKKYDLSAMILSAMYWPPFREEPVTLPAVLRDELDAYTKAYETTKVNRTLKWEPHLGQVEIDIEMDNGQVLSFKTTPVNVAIIMAFQEKERYTVEELCSRLETSSAIVKRRIAFWQAQGVLREDPVDVFHLNESVTERSAGESNLEEDEEAATASAEKQEESEYETLWTYVNGMLINMGSLPLERICAMLRMFAQTQKTDVELKKFLDRNVKDERLVYAVGVYKLAS